MPTSTTAPGTGMGMFTPHTPSPSTGRVAVAGISREVEMARGSVVFSLANLGSRICYEAIQGPFSRCFSGRTF